MNRSRILVAMVLLVLLVAPALAATFTFSPDPSGQRFSLAQNQTFTYDFNVSVPENLVIYSIEQPNYTNVSIDPSTGVLTLFAENADVGANNSLIVNAKNRSNLIDAASITVGFNISNINDPPSITATSPSSPISASENDTINLSLNGTDPDLSTPGGEVLNISWLVNGTLNETDAGAQGVFNYTIGFCQAGTLLIDGVLADDSGVNDTKVWTVNVADVNRNVTFNGTMPDQTFNESTGEITNFSIYSRFLDPDQYQCMDEIFTFTLDNSTNTTLSINQTTGEVRFNASPEWSGNETVTITATDHAGSNATSNNFTIHVLPQPDAPVGFEPGNQTTYQGVPYELYVRFEDNDLPYGDNLSYALNDTSKFNVSWYNVSGNRSYARIAFTPGLADVGNGSYRLSATDTYALSASVNFTLEVKPNDPPVIASPLILPNATQDTYYQVLVNATDPNGDPISWFINDSRFGGAYNASVGAYSLPAVNTTQGNLSFTPTNALVGNYSLRIFASDTKFAVDNVTTNLTVLNVNDPPVNLTPSGGVIRAKVNASFSHSVNVEDPDFPYGENVTITTNESLLTLTRDTANGSTWTMSATPGDADVGNYSVLLVADDGQAQINTTFTLEVLPPLPPVLKLPIANLTTQASTPYRTLVEATDPNGDTLTFTYNETVWSLNKQTLNTTASLINATFNSGQVGNYSINVTVTDTDGMSDSAVVSFVVQPFNLPPNLTDPRNITFVKGNTTNYTFHVADAENDPWVAYFNQTNLSWINITAVNSTAFTISATPNASQVGFWQGNLTINQTAYPPRNSSYLINITVYDDLQAPQITNINPPVGSRSWPENTSHVFEAKIDDPNFASADTVTYTWTFENQTLKSAQIHAAKQVALDLALDFCAAPGGNLVLKATDASNLSVSATWQLTVPNVNRPPVFGEKRFTYPYLKNSKTLSYQTGSWTMSGIVDNGSHLVQNATGVDGVLTSPVLDLGVKKSIVKANITHIDVQGQGPVTVQMRFGSAPNTADPSWTNWSSPVDAGAYPGNLTIQEYAQIRYALVGASGNVSSISETTLNYGFASPQNIKSDTNYEEYYFLDDYFEDPDYVECSDNTINATTNGLFLLNLTIDPNDRSVRLYTSETGVETINFTYSDGQANATSNDITFDISENPQTNPIVVPSGGGGGGGSSVTTITKPVEVPKDVPKPLEIITPRTATMYQNETLSIPISVVNNWNDTLSDIRLTAESDNENVTLALGTTRIQSLAPGVNDTFNLTVTSYATYGEYAIKVHASVADPQFNDTGTILINSIELGQRGNDTYNTKLSFARDIVQSNPRCLELNEQIKKASQLVKAGSTDQAVQLLDDVVANCQYLVSLGNNTLSGNEKRSWLTRIMQETSTETKVYVGAIVLVNAMLLGLVGVYLFRNHRSRRAKRRQKAQGSGEITPASLTADEEQASRS